MWSGEWDMCAAPGLRQEEIAAMGGPDEFAEFYRRLKQLKDHHRK